MAETFFPSRITNWPVPKEEIIEVGDDFEGSTVIRRGRDWQGIERMDLCKTRTVENCKDCLYLKTCGAPLKG